VALELRIDSRAGQFKTVVGKSIDPRNGTAQIAGLSSTACRIYGEWRSLMALLEDLNGGYLS